MFGTPFTEPVGTKALENIFDGDMEAMYKYACEYIPGEGGPKDLGAEFRAIIKNRNRTEWWHGCKLWLESEMDKGSGAVKLGAVTYTRKVFTRPKGERVLATCFSGSVEAMYDYACRYVPGEGGATDLGAVFRGIVKTVNREHWWKGCKKWLEDEKSAKFKQSPDRGGLLGVFRR